MVKEISWSDLKQSRLSDIREGECLKVTGDSELAFYILPRPEGNMPSRIEAICSQIDAGKAIPRPVVKPTSIAELEANLAAGVVADPIEARTAIEALKVAEARARASALVGEDSSPKLAVTNLAALEDSEIRI